MSIRPSDTPAILFGTLCLDRPAARDDQTGHREATFQEAKVVAPAVAEDNQVDSHPMQPPTL
jgi:hypothetical protein